MNLKVISRNVGFALLASAFFMFLSILVSISNGNDSALAALIISFTITFIVGIFPFIFVRKSPNISLKDGYMIIVLSWTLSFIFGMLPYVLWGGPFSVINALFEAVSGYTTTGGTVLANVEQLPDSLLFWRSSTHFIGGLGVVVFLLLIIPSSSPVRLRLTNMEVSSLSREGYKTRTNKTVWVFTAVYFGIAICAFLCYWLSGMSPFDAINHAFAVTATGGFSTKNLSIASFGSPLINIVTIFFMFISSIHFGIIYMVFASRSFKPLNNPVLKFYAGTILVAALLVAFSLKMSSAGFTWGESFMTGFFQVVSSISTTGFAISDNNTWPLFACIITVLITVPCGMAGSTTGGIKMDRMLLMFKSVGQQVKSSTVEIPKPVSFFQPPKESRYVFQPAASMALTILSGMDVQNSLASSISCLSNVGPAMESAGTMGNYSGVPVLAKIVFIVDMFLGRVEIYPVLAVVTMAFSGRK